jgi:hypothetical protein
MSWEKSKPILLILCANSDHSVTNLLLLLLLLQIAIELLLGGSSPYTSTDKINKNKYT